MEANEATQTHCYNPVAPAYPVWANAKRILLASPPADWRRQLGRPPHHGARHRPTGSETTPPYAPRSSRFGSEPPSVNDDVDVWRHTIELHARNYNDDAACTCLLYECWHI